MTRDQVKRVVAYLRVSTAEQGDSGIGLEAQRQQIADEAERRGWEVVAVYSEVVGHSKRLTRKQARLPLREQLSKLGRAELVRALATLDGREADALVVTKLDRLTRSLLTFVSLVDEAKGGDWAVIVLGNGSDFDMSTPAGKAMANMLAVFAEFERDMISQRTREALAVVKARGPAEGKKAIGRPKAVTPAIEQRILRMRRRGMSYEAIAAKLTGEGIPTPTGLTKGGQTTGTWKWTSVQRIAKRQGAK